MDVSTVIQNRNEPIGGNTSSNFVSADHVMISCGPPGMVDNTNDYYAIGLTQRIDYRDGRQVIQQGEIGSNATLTMIGESQKSLSLNKTIIKGNSLLYALYYAQYRLLAGGGAPANDDFQLISEAIDDGFDVPVGKDYGADDVIGGADVILGVMTDPDGVYGGPNDLTAIGLTQGFQLQSNMPIKQVNEMGTHAKFIIAGKADKSMAFSRIMLDTKSALSAIYGTNESIIQDLQDKRFRVPKDIYLIFMNKTNDDYDSIISLEKSVITDIGSQNTAGEQSTLESLSLSWNKSFYHGHSAGPVNSLGGDSYGIGDSNIWLDLDHYIFRKPFNLLLTYCDADNKVLGQQILDRALMSSIGKTFAAGSYTTVEGGALSWENTVTL